MTGEMGDFGGSDKMIKISGKADKSKHLERVFVVIFRSLFTELLQTNIFFF